MQSLFILALFGVIYTTIAVITTMLASSSMQLKQERIENVKQLFADMEEGIVNGYLGNNVDFNALNFTINGNDRLDASINTTDPKRVDNFLTQYVSWSGDDMLEDPWRQDYYFGVATVMQDIYADTDNPDGVNNVVTAPLSAFIFVSAGPDRKFGTDPALMPSTYNDIRRYTLPATADAEDDIVLVFTTFSTMNEIWNHTKSVHDKVMASAADSYRQKYDLFAPTIQTEFYDKVDFYDSSFNWIGDDPASGCSTALIHAWKNPNCNVPNVTGGNLANLTLYPQFPVFSASIANTSDELAEELGVDQEKQRLLQNLTDDLILTMSSTPNVGLNDRMDFELQEAVDTDWQIVYKKRLNGADIISGF